MRSRKRHGYSVLPARAKKDMTSIGQAASRKEIMLFGVRVRPVLSTMLCAEYIPLEAALRQFFTVRLYRILTTTLYLGPGTRRSLCIWREQDGSMVSSTQLRIDATQRNILTLSVRIPPRCCVTRPTTDNLEEDLQSTVFDATQFFSAERSQIDGLRSSRISTATSTCCASENED